MKGSRRSVDAPCHDPPASFPKESEEGDFEKVDAARLVPPLMAFAGVQMISLKNDPVRALRSSQVPRDRRDHIVSTTCWACPGTSWTELKKWTYRDPERALRSHRFPDSAAQASRHAVTKSSQARGRRKSRICLNV